jgi:hypothetical protein
MYWYKINKNNEIESLEHTNVEYSKETKKFKLTYEQYKNFSEVLNQNKGILVIDGNFIISETKRPSNKHFLNYKGEWEIDSKNLYVFIEDIRKNTLENLQSKHAEVLRNYTDKVTIEEMLTWPIKLDAAKSIKNGTTTEEQKELLEGEAEITLETIDDLTNKILDKSKKYHNVIGKLSGVLRKYTKLIKNKLTYSEIIFAKQNFNREIENIEV